MVDNNTMPVLTISLLQNTTSPIVFYNRCSSWGQAGPGKVSLKIRTEAAISDLCRRVQVTISNVVYGVEIGWIESDRKSLIRAVELAKDIRGIIVSPDLSRLIRPVMYYRGDRTAVPSSLELQRLVEITKGVTLVTTVDPSASAAIRHSEATKRVLNRHKV